MKKLLLSVLCLLGTGLIGAFGATKLATFVGFDILTQGNFTANLNGNTLNSDGTVTIGTAPMIVAGPSTTYWAQPGMSIVMKYSSLPSDRTENKALVTSQIYQNGAVVAEDGFGCYVDTSGYVGCVWKGSVETSVGSNTIGTSGYIVLTYYNGGSTGIHVYDGSGNALFTDTSKGQGGTLAANTYIGGLSGSTLVAEGLTIEGLVFYQGVLSSTEAVTAVTEYEAAATEVANAITLDGTATSTSAINETLDSATSGTLKVTAATTLTYDEDFTASTVNIRLTGDLTIYVPEGSTFTHTGVISGTGKLIKTGAGTFIPTSANTFTGGLYVNEGTVKSGGTAGNETPVFGYYTTSLRLANGNLSTIAVESGATLDLSGSRGACYDITVNGGTVINSDSAMGNTQCQTTQLTLTADSTVGGDYAFGLVGRSYETTYINLDGYTLVKTNSNNFILNSTVVTNRGDTASGRIRIDQGTVTMYYQAAGGHCNLTGSTIEIGSEGTLAYNSLETAPVGVSVTGSGTVSLGTIRPSTGINFETDNAVTLSITLTEDESSSETITVNGTGTPGNVTVYLTDGTTIDPSATVSSSENGTITISMTLVDSLSFPNPVTGETQEFTYEFVNTAGDNDWANTQNWYTAANNRYLAYSGTLAPALSNSATWDPCVFSNQVGVTSSENIDGWNMRFGLFNGSTVTITPGKFQPGSDGMSWFMVDETSKLTFSMPSSLGNFMRETRFFVAAQDGVEFSSGISKTTGRFVYHLKGDGSIKFNGAVTMATNKVGTVVLDAYTTQPTDQELTYGLVKAHPLVTVTSWGSQTFDLDSAAVYFNNTYAEDNLSTKAATAELTTADATQSACGKYYIYKSDTGIYIDYIGYAADAQPYDGGIKVYVR